MLTWWRAWLLVAAFLVMSAVLCLFGEWSKLYDLVDLAEVMAVIAFCFSLIAVIVSVFSL